MKYTRTNTGFLPRPGMTLAELTIVLSVLGMVLALVLPSLGKTYSNSVRVATNETLDQIRSTILSQYYDDAFESLPYPVDPARVPHPQLAYLYVSPVPGLSYDPVSRRGWRGPYLLTTGGIYAINTSRGFTDRYGLNGDPAPLDGWGNPIVLQQPWPTTGAASASDLAYARLVSAGPNGILETPPGMMLPTAAQCGDDVVVRLGAGP